MISSPTPGAKWPKYNLAVPDRSRLHELVDTLPEAALAVAQGALEHYQTWPPRQPPQVRAFQERGMERMRQSMRPGTVGGFGGGGSYRMGPGGRIEYGSQSQSYWEDDTAVVITHRFHAGHEIAIEERLRLDAATNNLIYTHEATGPDGSRNRREIVFSIPL